MVAGRPSDYSEELAENIVSLLRQGYSVHEICKQDDMPSEASFYTWLKVHPKFLEKYREGRDDQTDALMDKIVMASNMLIRGEGEASSFGVAIRGYETAAKRMAPRKYGDRMQSEVSGPNGSAIQVVLPDYSTPNK